MKFLVTGATSGLGRNATEWLLESGYQVCATGRNLQAGEELSKLGAQFTAHDLVTASDEAYQQLMSDCDVIWHCAALSSPWGKYQDFYQANVVVTQRLAQLAGKLGIKRFVHVSTPSLYFDFQSHLNIPEQQLAKRFANNYAKTKYLAEEVIRQSISLYPQTIYIMLRPRGIFGPYDRVLITRVLDLIARTKGTLPLPGAGKAFIDLTFVLNVVHAMFLASTRQQLQSGEVFNITNQQPKPLHEMLTMLIKEKLQIDFSVRALPYFVLYGLACINEWLAKITHKEPALTRYSVGTLYFDMTLNPDLASKRLGYKPIYSLEEGIDITAEWLLHNGNLPYGKTNHI